MIGARLILEDGSYFEGELFGAAQADTPSARLWCCNPRPAPF